MAIIECAECGKEVADTAKSCPHCGFDTRSKRLVRWKIFLILWPIALLGGAVVYWLVLPSTMVTSTRFLVASVACLAILFIGWELMGKRNVPSQPKGFDPSEYFDDTCSTRDSVPCASRMPPVKYIAQLQGVRELGLHGVADLSWWRAHLAGEGLEPVEADGAAQILVTGLDARWLAWPFRDLSVAVVARRAGTDETGIFYARAFNTSRFLVFFEKRWFKLPYSRRAVSVQLGNSASMRLGDSDLVAEMAPREPEGEPHEMGYTGPLFLPGRRWLMVNVHGLTSTFDFDGARDRFAVAPECADPVVAGLRASQFRGICWHVRRDATHARSKTLHVRG